MFAELNSEEKKQAYYMIEKRKREFEKSDLKNW